MYASLHCHVVFSTKDRLPTITSATRKQLHDYLGGTIRGLGAFPETMGGVDDHVHLLFGFKPVQSIAEIVRETKKSTTAWAREHINPGFAWQEGYAVFGVSASAIDSVKHYIETQEEHHRKTNYLDELRNLLREAKVPFDEKYLA